MERQAAEFAQQAYLESRAETDIIEALDKLVTLAQDARLTDTIVYLAICRALVRERQFRRKAERH